MSHEQTIAYTAEAGWHMATVDTTELLALLADHDQEGYDMNPLCDVEHCGEPLSGGGAPRGWVLVRIIGSGDTPRRYHSPLCAVAALTPDSQIKPQGAGARRSADRIRTLGVKPAVIRRWALEHGHTSNRTGVIPGDVIDLWVQAHRAVS